MNDKPSENVMRSVDSLTDGMVSRRGFIGAAVASAAVAGLHADSRASWTVDGIPLPDWAADRIRSGVARYNAWRGKDETVAFPLITDVHSHEPGFAENPPNWNDPKSHILFQRAIAHATDSDFLVNLGDLDFDINILGAKPEWSDVQAVIDGFVRVYEKEPLPVLFSMGNHDHAKGRYTSKQFGDTFNRGITARAGHKVVLSECGTWGYYDIPAKKFRAVFLNTSDEGYAGYSRKQLQFLSDALATVPEEWHVIALQHIQVPGIMGRWRRGLDDGPLRREGIFMQIVDDFAHHRGNLVQGFHKPPIKGQYDGIKWDFAESKASFVGGFFGHTHLEANMQIDGVNWVTRPGYGTVPADCPCMGARDPKCVWEFKRSKDMMIDLVAVKPEKRVVHVFRFGYGGPESELEYKY